MPFRLALGLAVLVSGCLGEIGDVSDEVQQFNPADPPTVAECQNVALDTGLTGVRRLTRDQYNNTIRDLRGDTSDPAMDFSVDGISGGFESNVNSAVDGVQLENYLYAAEDLATAYVGGGLANDLSCDRADSACARQFLTDFGRRAFRKPLSDELLDGLVTLYESGRDQWDADVGFRLAIEAILVSPHFLYLVELVRACPRRRCCRARRL